MGTIKNVELDEQLNKELTAAGEKLVVVYYSATWCAPCKKIKPVLEALSKKYPNVVFLKLDVDTCQETAIAQGVTAMPTFAFHKNVQKLDMLLGADPVALEDKINEHMKSKNESAVAPGNVDLRPLISIAQCECMNESDDNPYSNVFNQDDSYLESDCDAQLIMTVTFKQPVKIHSLRIKAPLKQGPKDLKIFKNQGQTLSFDAAESNTPVQVVTLFPPQLSGSPVPLQFVKFQNVTNIQIYVKNNQTSAPKTIITQMNFIGAAMNSTNMGDFKRASGKKGQSLNPWKNENFKAIRATRLNLYSVKGNNVLRIPSKRFNDVSVNIYLKESS